MLMTGTLPNKSNADVHSAEDVILSATGPGAEQFRGSIDNTDVFRFIVNALSLGRKK
jgi:alkaline phosphatase